MGASTTRKIYLFLIMLTMEEVLCTRRSGVLNTGTTMGPGFSRKSGKASILCPSNYPFSYGRGQYCCQHMYKLNDSSVSPECNGAKSNTYSDIRCCPNADYLACSTGNTCKTFKIATVSCPFTNAYALDRGLYCCNSLKRLNNPGINPSCIGGKLQVTDPNECCSSALIPCSNIYTGCFTNKGNGFNATKMLLFGDNVQDSILDLATSTITLSSNPSWPQYASSTRGRPFGAAYDQLMIICEGGTGPNVCYRSIIGKPQWYAGPNTVYTHNTPGSVMVQTSKLWVIGGFTPTTELFDFTTQTWSAGPVITPSNLATSGYINAAALDDNRVLVFGACVGWAGAAIPTTYLYDFGTGQWSTMASPNPTRCDNGGGLIWLPGGIPAPIAAGGWNAGGLTNSVQMYNATSSTWTALATFPISVCRIYHCMANNRC